MHTGKQNTNELDVLTNSDTYYQRQAFPNLYRYSTRK